MATASFPNSNLSTTSQPWGREVEKRIVDTAIKVDSNEVNNNARDTQLLAALNRTNIAAATAQQAADKAQEAIDNITSVEEAVYYPGTTEINGGNIRANTIAANKISAGELVGFTVKTAYSGQRVEMNSTTMNFYDSNGNSAGQIVATPFSPTVASMNVNSNTGGSGLLMFNDLASIYGKNGSSIQVGTTTNGNIDINANTTNGGVTLGANYISLLAPNVDSSGRITAGTFFTSNGLVGTGTTGASINSAGSIIRTPSSARYKQDIEPASFDYEDILSLQPKTFRLKDEVLENDNARRYAGFIAEEIAKTPLDVFVSYREGENGEQEPDGVYYAELTSALLLAIKHQDSLIHSLTARIEALENKVK